MKKRLEDLVKRSLGIFLFSIDGEEGGGGADPDHVPTQEEIALELEGGADLNEPVVEKDENGNPIVPQAKEEVVLDDYTKEFVAMQGEGYELPEEIKTGKDKEGNDISVKDRLAFMTKEITKSNEPTDPFVKAFLNAKTAGTEQELLQGITKAYSNLELDDKTFYKNSLMNTKGKSEERPNGIEEAEIDKHIESLDAISLKDKTDARREIYKKNLDDYFNQENERSANAKEMNIEKINSETQKFIEPYLAIVKENGLGDIPFSEELTEAYLNDVSTMTVKDKTYQNDIEKFLSQDKNMVKMLPYIWLVMKGKEQSLFSNVKETSKQNAIDKLYPEGELGGGAAATPGKLNVAKLTAPDTQ